MGVDIIIFYFYLELCSFQKVLVAANTAFNDLRIIICLRKYKVSAEKKNHIATLLKNCRSMAFTVCEALGSMTSYICHQSN